MTHDFSCLFKLKQEFDTVKKLRGLSGFVWDDAEQKCQEAALTRRTSWRRGEEELGLARLVSSYTLPHQNSQPGGRGQQTACSKVLSRHARDT